MTRNHWLIICGLTLSVVVVFACLGFLAIGTPIISMQSSRPTIGTRSNATSTPVSLNYKELNAKFPPLTDAQQVAYIKSISGTRVRITGTVQNVLSNGQINLSLSDCITSPCVLVQKTPSNIAQSLRRGQTVTVIGTISESSDYLVGLLLEINYESLE